MNRNLILFSAVMLCFSSIKTQAEDLYSLLRSASPALTQEDKSDIVYDISDYIFEKEKARLQEFKALYTNTANEEERELLIRALKIFVFKVYWLQSPNAYLGFTLRDAAGDLQKIEEIFENSPLKDELNLFTRAPITVRSIVGGLSLDVGDSFQVLIDEEVQKVQASKVERGVQYRFIATNIRSITVKAVAYPENLEEIIASSNLFKKYFENTWLEQLAK